MGTVSDAEQSLAWRASRRAARRFRESGGNPLYLWQCVALCIEASIPYPVAARNYLARVAARLGVPGEARISKPGAFVMAALELAGKGPSAFERRRRFEIDVAVASMAASIRRAPGLGYADALEHAGRDPDSLARQRRRRTKVAKTCP